MSIRIRKKDCVGCGRCIEACPGNLIKRNEEGKAYIRRERDCWGCTACLKSCRAGAIDFFLGADIGGLGSRLTVKEKEDVRIWTVTRPDGRDSRIEVYKKESNKY